MDNLSIYEQCREVPENALREIKAGNLKGKSDINPVWRIKKLTELYGPVGIGWYSEITKEWTEKGAGEEVILFVKLKLFVKHDGEWSKGIEGTGGNMLINNYKAGLKSNDEALKMAETDAISVACKKLGIGADVYWSADNTKYGKASEETLREKVEKETGRKFETKKDGKIILTEKAKETLQKLKTMLWTLGEKDEDKTLDLLEAYTAFKGKEGNEVKGVRSFDNLSEKRIFVIYGKVKDVYESSIKKAS